MERLQQSLSGVLHRPSEASKRHARSGIRTRSICATAAEVTTRFVPHGQHSCMVREWSCRVQNSPCWALALLYGTWCLCTRSASSSCRTETRHRKNSCRHLADWAGWMEVKSGRESVAA